MHRLLLRRTVSLLMEFQSISQVEEAENQIRIQLALLLHIKGMLHYQEAKHLKFPLIQLFQTKYRIEIERSLDSLDKRQSRCLELLQLFVYTLRCLHR